MPPTTLSNPVSAGGQAALGNLAGTQIPAELMAVLKHLLTAIDDIRDQLSGTHKSHYCVEEVARMTGRSPYTIRRWVAERRLKATKVEGTGPKGRLLIPHEDVSRLIERGLGAKIPATLAATCPRD